MADATGRAASTIHRLLGYSLDGEFTVDESDPLKADMVIVDEASMIDLELFSHLLEAIPPRAHLMLVGDVDQLPSVGAGDVLRDVIASGLAHVTRLDVIFRQAIENDGRHGECLIDRSRTSLMAKLIVRSVPTPELEERGRFVSGQRAGQRDQACLRDGEMELVRPLAGR